MSKTETSLHIDPYKLIDVVEGRLDFRTCVGQVREENPRTGRVEWMNAYVHFEFQGGRPRLTQGKVRLNCRPQRPLAQRVDDRLRYEDEYTDY